MKQVKGYDKEYYIKECKEDGGSPVEFCDLYEAAQALCKYLKTRGWDEADLSQGEAEDSILNDTNCDWILMDDGTVLWRRYPSIEEERACSGNVRLRELRKKAGLSQSQLAEKAGVSVRVYQNYEQEVRDISKAQLSTLLRICNALHCKLSDIITDEETAGLLKQYEK